MTPICKKTVKHEVGHAIGIFAHTEDGGLMDIDGGDGTISKQVERIIKTIYSNPPDSATDSLTILQ